MRHEMVPYGRHFQVGVDGLTVTGTPPFEAWEALLHALRSVEVGLQFAVGDALRYGEERFGEQASQAIDEELGWTEQTLKVYRWVAARVPPENRRPDLSFRHHMAVASLGVKAQRTWLAKAAGDGGGSWTVQRLKVEMASDGAETETAYWVAVKARDAADQQELVRRLIADGRVCRATERHELKQQDRRRAVRA